MQPVSQEWKTAQRQTLVPESFVNITMKVGDPDAQADASLSDNGHAYIANTPDVLAQTADPVKYATAEPFLWVLDGTFRIVGGSGGAGSLKPYGGFIPLGQKDPLVCSDGQSFYCLE